MAFIAPFLPYVAGPLTWLGIDVAADVLEAGAPIAANAGKYVVTEVEGIATGAEQAGEATLTDIRDELSSLRNTVEEATATGGSQLMGYVQSAGGLLAAAVVFDAYPRVLEKLTTYFSREDESKSEQPKETYTKRVIDPNTGEYVITATPSDDKNKKPSQ